MGKFDNFLHMLSMCNIKAMPIIPFCRIPFYVGDGHSPAANAELWHLEEDTVHREEDSRGSPTHGVSQMRKSESRSTTPSAHRMTCSSS